MTGKLETFNKDAIMSFGPNRIDRIILFRLVERKCKTLIGLLSVYNVTTITCTTNNGMSDTKCAKPL